jgi:hypothetical protein
LEGDGKEQEIKQKKEGGRQALGIKNEETDNKRDKRIEVSFLGAKNLLLEEKSQKNSDNGN